MTEETLSKLKAYPWPGNVRELENAVEYMINLMDKDGTVDVDTLPESVRTYEESAGRTKMEMEIRPAREAIRPLKALEKEMIGRALSQYGKSTAGKREAAEALGISRATLYRKLQEYGLE